ncbi:MAG TPA: hypothetical protein VF780_02535 [Nitrosospira sp.]
MGKNVTRIKCPIAIAEVAAERRNTQFRNKLDNFKPVNDFFIFIVLLFT